MSALNEWLCSRFVKCSLLYGGEGEWFQGMRFEDKFGGFCQLTNGGIRSKTCKEGYWLRNLHGGHLCFGSAEGRWYTWRLVVRHFIKLKLSKVVRK